MQEELSIVRQLALRHFGDAEPSTFIEKAAREEVHAQLSRRIADLLANDVERLVGILYRIDVPEAAFHQALATHQPADILADFVIKRLLLKARTRLAYRKYRQDSES